MAKYRLMSEDAGKKLTALLLYQIIANSGGSAALSELFEINMADEYYVQNQSDAPNIIANAININGFTGNIGTSGIAWKKPTVSVPTISWGDTVDNDYNIVGTGTVQVAFGNAGAISKTVTFKKPGEGKLYACKMSDTTSRIDTGIAGNYAYRFHVKGHTIGSSMAVLADAFVDSTNRTTARLLGSSNKLQHMWYSNKEQQPETSVLNLKKMFEMTHGGNYLYATQGNQVLNPTITGQTTSGSVGANITLMGSNASGYGNSVLSFAEILDGSGNTIAYFSPYKIQGGEVVMVNTAGLTAQQIYDIVQNGDGAENGNRIFRPTNGTLIEVTQAEDEA